MTSNTSSIDDRSKFVPPRRIRLLAVGLLLYEDRLLLAEGHDHVKNEVFYRGLGGEIEFGESAVDALVREFSEELGSAVEIRAHLGTVENRFTLQGEPGHEVIIEYLVQFATGQEPSGFEPIEATEGEYTFTAKWLPLTEVLAGLHRVYPEGVSERLAEWVNTL